ncbi:hypothetical protein N752_07330 [Desulforamulus aquiferis]|nr:undecaprenyl-phosphate galactose phosphotransferase WbaP [Desulforamulus aquiferis]RYD05701.1 hypothetical protein N752_07330 [Desulforamulus aquiferis]
MSIGPQFNRRIFMKYSNLDNKSINFTSGFISVLKVILHAATLLAIDLIAFYLISCFSVVITTYIFADSLINFVVNTHLVCYPIIMVMCVFFDGLYTSRITWWREFEKLIRSSTLAFVITLAILFLTKLEGEVFQTIILSQWILTLIFIPIARYFSKITLYKYSIYNCSVLIIGATKMGKLLANVLEKERTMGYEVVGFIDNNISPGQLVSQHEHKTLRVLGNFLGVSEVMKVTGVKDVIIAVHGLSSTETVKLINHLHNVSCSILMIPDLFRAPLSGVEVDYFFSDKTLILRFKNNLNNQTNILIKKSIDLILGATVFIIALPLLILIFVVIGLDSRGSPIFIQKRLGVNGKTFNCYKFRTMVTNAEEVLKQALDKNEDMRKEWQVNFKLKKDPRITKIGRFLRKTSLDELPQIINIIKGEMSLVGPRPRPLYELDGLEENELFQIGLSVKPGVTGLWQVSGRSNLDFNQRIDLDAWYVQNWSPWLDLFLLIKTIGVVLNGKGAY